MPFGQQGADHGCRQQPSCSWQAECRLLQVSAVPHLQVQMHNIVAVQIDQAADHVQQQGGTCRQVNLVNLVSSWVAWL